MKPSFWYKISFWYHVNRDLHRVDRRQRQMCIRDRVYSTLRRNSFKLAKKPQNLSQDENVIFLVVIREKKLTFLLSPQVNLRSGDPCLSFCLGDEKKGPYRRLTTGRPGVLYANTGNNKASGFMGPRKRVGAGVD